MEKTSENAKIKGLSLKRDNVTDYEKILLRRQIDFPCKEDPEKSFKIRVFILYEKSLKLG